MGLIDYEKPLTAYVEVNCWTISYVQGFHSTFSEPFRARIVIHTI